MVCLLWVLDFVVLGYCILNWWIIVKCCVVCYFFFDLVF